MTVYVARYFVRYYFKKDSGKLYGLWERAYTQRIDKHFLFFEFEKKKGSSHTMET